MIVLFFFRFLDDNNHIRRHFSLASEIIFPGTSVTLLAIFLIFSGNIPRNDDSKDIYIYMRTSSMN